LSYNIENKVAHKPSKKDLYLRCTSGKIGRNLHRSACRGRIQEASNIATNPIVYTHG